MVKNPSTPKSIPELKDNQTIQRWKVSNLIPNPLNYQIYSRNDVGDLIESIRKNNGKILVPLVITPKGVIISGHRRYQAAQIIGLEDVNVIIEDIDDTDVKFKMIQYNIYRRKKYSEILNEIDILYEHYGRQQGKRNDLTSVSSEESLDVHSKIAKTVGISTGTMSYLININKIKPEYIARIDDGLISIKKAWLKCKTELKTEILSNGKLYPKSTPISDFKIYNKSCHDLSREIKDNTIQLIFTSPPYYRMKTYKSGGKELGQEKTSEEYIENLTHLLKDSYRVLKPDGSLFLNLGDCRKNWQLLNIPHRVLSEVLKLGFFFIHSIVWNKTNVKPTKNYRVIQPSYEYIFHLTKSLKYKFHEDVIRPFLLTHLPQILSGEKQPSHPVYGETLPFATGNIYDFWTNHDILQTPSFHPYVKSLTKYGEHPSQMNLLTPILPILLTTEKDDTVLDVFCGNGTTGIAALSMGRKFLGYEINKTFYESTHRRLTAFSDEIHQ